MVAGGLHVPRQPAAQVVWTSVQRTLQVADCGRERQRIFANGVRLRASESGAGEVAFAGTAAAAVCVEQLAEVFAAAGQTACVAAGGTVAGRISATAGQRGGAEKNRGGIGGGGRGGCGRGAPADAAGVGFLRQVAQERRACAREN